MFNKFFFLILEDTFALRAHFAKNITKHFPVPLRKCCKNEHSFKIFNKEILSFKVTLFL